LYIFLFLTTQIAQEGQHEKLRMEKKGVFKRHCADCKHIQYHMQKIINALRLRWDVIESPPLLHVNNKGSFDLVIVSPKLYHPYELITKSKFLKTKKLYFAFQTAIFALWQVKETKNPFLKRDLIKQRNQSQLSEQDFKDQLTWFVQHSHSYFQLHWISV